MHPLCLLALVSHFGFPSSVFPRTLLLGSPLPTSFPALSLWCCVCVFQFRSVYCLSPPPTPFWFSNVSWTCFSFEESCYLCVVHLFAWLVFLFQSYAAFLTRGVQMQNYPPKNILSVYSQCSCRLVYRYLFLEEIRPHWAWLGSMVISGSHLEMLFTVPCGSITI